MPDIVVPKKFRRVARGKPQHLRAAIERCIGLLVDNPRHPGLNVHRVQGTSNVWEAYVDKANRLTFHYDDEGRIVLRNNCNHDIVRRSP